MWTFDTINNTIKMIIQYMHMKIYILNNMNFFFRLIANLYKWIFFSNASLFKYFINKLFFSKLSIFLNILFLIFLIFLNRN